MWKMALWVVHVHMLGVIFISQKKLILGVLFMPAIVLVEQFFFCINFVPGLVRILVD